MRFILSIILLALITVAIPINAQTQPDNDYAPNGLHIEALPYSHSISAGSMARATINYFSEPSPCVDDLQHTVWYEFVLTEDVKIEIDPEGSEFRTVIGLYVENGGRYYRRDCATGRDPMIFTFDADLAASGQQYRLSIGSDGDDVGRLVLNVRRAPAKIQVFSGDEQIYDRTRAVPDYSLNTSFGDGSQQSVTNTFTIRNDGQEDLLIDDIQITGTHADEFSLTALPDATVVGLQTTTFDITYSPSDSATHLRDANVHIISNDSDNNSFDIPIQGAYCPAYSYPHTVTSSADLQAAILCIGDRESATIDLDGKRVFPTIYTSDDGITSTLPIITTDLTLTNGTISRLYPSNRNYLHVGTGGKLTLNNINITKGGSDGAVYVSGTGELIIRNSELGHNYIAVQAVDNSKVTIINSFIYTSYKALISEFSSSFTVINSSIKYSQISAIEHKSSGKFIVVNTLMHRNDRPIITQHTDAQTTVINTIISGSDSSMFLHEGVISIINSTLAQSKTSILYQTGGTAEFVNSILWGNAEPIFGSDAEFDGVPSIQHSIVQGGYPGTGNLDSDPVFVNSEVDGFALNLTSPAINAGDTTALPTEAELGIDLNDDGDTDDPIMVDIRDDGLTFERVNGTAVDMGAYEYQLIARGADVNGDGIISPLDAIYVINRLGSTDASANVDGDNDIDTDDLTIIQDQWGGTSD